MDRRTFLTGCGAVGATGAVSAGIAIRDACTTQASATGLALAAGAGSRARAAATATTVRTAPASVAHGLTLGYLPVSAAMFAAPTIERLMRASAIGSRWARWDASSASQAGQAASHRLFRVSSLVDLSIGVLRRADVTAAGTLRGLDIVAHFAIDESPYFAPFEAWRYEAAGVSAPAKSTQPLTFGARVPGFLSLQVNYAIDAAAVATGVSRAGTLYLPIGAGAASGAGLSTGLYVFAAPSAYTGVQPDLSACVFSGNVHAPLADLAGRALDFDYLTLAIRPVAI